MRVLLHIDSLGSGGAQRQIVELGKGLARRGHAVELNTYHRLDHFRPQLERAGIPVRTIEKGSRFSIAPIFALARQARAMRAQVIVAFLQTPMLQAEIVKLMVPECKVVGSHRAAYPSGRHGASFWVHQQFHRLADAMTTNSSREQANMANKFGWLGGKTTVVRNGYEITPPAPSDGCIGDELRLLALATVYPLKDPLSLARALDICRNERGIKVSISWAGVPLVRDGHCAAQDEVDAFLAAKALSDHWCWLGLRSDIPDLLAAHHALVHTSLSEGFSNSVAEALVVGRPIIVGRTGEQETLVAESSAGLLFDVGDPKDIARAIADFHALTDSERAAMAHNGHAFAAASLSLESMVDGFEAVLERVVAGD